MDHLPFPGSTAGFVHTVVPYVCKEEYDGGPFMTYPSRAGLSSPLHVIGIDGDPEGHLSVYDRTYLDLMPKQNLESFCQTWLFFGLIHEILGSLCKLDQYVSLRENGHGLVKALSTSKLNENLAKWVKRMRDGDTDGFPTHQHVLRCLRQARATLQAISSNIDSEINISLSSLGQNLTYAAGKAFDDAFQVVGCWPIDDSHWNAPLLASGWCTSQTQLILETTSNIQSLHFLACMRHTETVERHQRCDGQQCKAYQNDLERYETQHVTENCTCEELIIDESILFQILERGFLPLLRVNKHDSLTQISVDIVPSHDTSRYVALSHVWAHGLGNPYANALPRCQLSYLWRLVEQLNKESEPRDAEELLLWCDTLCCPVRPKEAKELALKEMYRTYEDATCVLVLEKSLLTYDLETLHLDEVCMRILNSSWMRRLWTLQEGALAAKMFRLWFQFRDKAVSLGTLYDHVDSALLDHDIGRKGLIEEIMPRLVRLRSTIGEDRKDPNDTNIIFDIMLALRHRSVSVPSDEPLLVANLLGLNIARLLDGPDSERYNRLWRLLHSQFGRIPQGLIFIVGPRLTDTGLRWAPATLLGLLNDGLPRWNLGATDTGILTAKDGLLVRFPGFKLSFPQRPKGFSLNLKSPSLCGDQTILMRDEYGSWYYLRRISTPEQDSTEKSLCAMLDAILKVDSDLWIIHPKNSKPKSLIVELLASNDGESGEKKARSRMHVAYYQFDEVWEDWLESMQTLAKQLSDSEASRKIASFDDGGEIESDLPEYSTAVEAWVAELNQLARSEKAKSTNLATGLGVDEGETERLIAGMFWGNCVIMGEKVPESQRWCID